MPDDHKEDSKVRRFGIPERRGGGINTFESNSGVKGPVNGVSSGVSSGASHGASHGVYTVFTRCYTVRQTEIKRNQTGIKRNYTRSHRVSMETHLR